MIPSPLLCSKGPWREKKTHNTHPRSGHMRLVTNHQWPSSDMSRCGASSCWYLAVGAVDERSFSQQVSEEGRQFSGQRHHLQDLGDPARHVDHGLVGESHIQSSVASFQPGTKRQAGQEHQVKGWTRTVNTSSWDKCDLPQKVWQIDLQNVSKWFHFHLWIFCAQPCITSTVGLDTFCKEQSCWPLNY